MATIGPKIPFDPEDACKILNEAMDGLRKDEDAIIMVVTQHCLAQRLELKDTYLTLFGEDLESELERALGGDVKDCVMALMVAPALHDARELRAAMKGLGTDDKQMIEVLVPKNNAHIELIKEAYEREFERNLMEDVEGAASGAFNKLLVSLVNAGRDESEDIDEILAGEDAQSLWDAGEGGFGTDESVFNMILCSRSVSQLRATFLAYKAVSGVEIEETIRSETKGDLCDAYLSIVACVRDVPSFYANLLKEAMAGLGTDEAALTRIMATRSEIDLGDIRDNYPVLFEKTLVEAIEDEVRGDTKKVLLAVLGEGL